MNDAKCFACLGPREMQLIELQLLCEILAASSTSVGAVDCGLVDPVVAPTNSCTLYYRTDNGGLWMWNGVSWIVLIAP
jgi:hypothetical protein